MIKSSAWLFAGAVLATAGMAHAQESTPVAPASETAAAQAGMPWYQRFTTSNGLTEAITGDRENDRLLPQAWTLNQHWGVTVDVREASRTERSADVGRGDQAAVGAYYQFTPNLRLGGEVSLESTPVPGTPGVRVDDNAPAAGVRVESAFRF